MTEVENKVSISKNYTKLDPIDHVLLRPEMYIGATKLRKSNEYIAIKNEENIYKILMKDIESSPAILRIFIEILSNAIDNYQRSVEANLLCTYIRININKETGETSVINDGDYIPIEINEKEKMYNHTLIFGNLLAGSNFDDENQERLVSGTNGIGSKGCNIFSKKFIVKAQDPKNSATFEQTWTNNMKVVSKPIIGKSKTKKAYTHVTYFPDFERFGMVKYSDDIINQYMKCVIDTALLTKIKVYFNDELIPVNSLLSYSKLFESPSDESVFIKHGLSEVVLTPSTEFESLTFVNGISTKFGGTHLEAWSEKIFKPLLEKINGKKTNTGKVNLSVKDIKQFFRIFITTSVINPRFESQSKHFLEFPKVEAVVKPSDINKILKWSIMSDIEDIIKSKEMLVLKKTEKKKKGYVKIDGYDPANLSGTKHSGDCSLIICEGLSAKTFGVAGISKGVYGRTGRDYFGILSLTGKCLNVRNSTPQIISKNKVITNLIQSVGLQYGVDYTNEENFKTLSYGKIILLTDADSVTFDTPCLLKNIKTSEIEIKPFCEINNGIWVEDKLSNKEYSMCDKYLVWSDKGWTKIKSIMRHKVNKPIFRVLTHTGCVDVTEDHSLLNNKGQAITVKDCKEKETDLLHNKYIQEKSFNYDNIDDDYAYALGYFQADGNCVTDLKVTQKKKDGTITHSTNSKWSICCVNIEPLEKLKLIFEKYENTGTNIKPVVKTDLNKQCTKCFKVCKDSYELKKHYLNKTPCNELKLYFEIKKVKVGKNSFSFQSGTEYKYLLEAKGVRKEIAYKYRNMFYNTLREKKVPTEILNSSIKVQQSFLSGFYAGDGNKGDKRSTDSFDGEYKSQIMGLFQVLQNCGYKPSINCYGTKLNVYKILMEREYNRPEHKIKKIIDVSEKYKDTYVYDFETENHHFHASVGNMIVHNTDGLRFLGK